MWKRNMNSLRKKYQEEILPKLQEKLGIKNSMACPRLSKIIVNMGVKDAVSDKKSIDKASEIMTQITGQKPKITSAKQSISSFKLREGDKIGVVATLRGRRMYDFFDKLTSVVLPRIKDFHGVNRTSFDGKGNYTLGFSEHTVFPEIDPGKVEKIQGLEITIVTTAKDNKEGMALLEGFGMPFKKG